MRYVRVVAQGDHDFIKPFLENNGTVHFGRLMMKPGKPATFATVPKTASTPAAGAGAGSGAGAGAKSGGSQSASASTLVFALPGNPVSALVTFHLFAATVRALRPNAVVIRPAMRPIASLTRGTRVRE